MNNIEFHPFANFFPLLPTESVRFKELTQDIQENGLIDTIELFEEKILDGRNRYRACLGAGIEPRFSQYTGDKPLAYVRSKNLQRRDLTDSQRAAIAVEMLPGLKEEAKKRQSTSGPGSLGAIKTASGENAISGQGTSRTQASQEFEVSEYRIRQAQAIQKADPELFERVKSGELSLALASSQITNKEQPNFKTVSTDTKNATEIVGIMTLTGPDLRLSTQPDITDKQVREGLAEAKQIAKTEDANIGFMRVHSKILLIQETLRDINSYFTSGYNELFDDDQRRIIDHYMNDLIDIENRIRTKLSGNRTENKLRIVK